MSMDEARKVWDEYAPKFDDEPDHGLRDDSVRQAWVDLLKQSLPPTPSIILDIGCGTGSLSLVMAEQGHTVTGVDFSPAMIELARAKAESANQNITFHVMDAAHPEFDGQQFDVIVCRHLLWALSEPDSVLLRWVDLLKANGRLLLIEGFWETGAGLKSEAIVDMLPASLGDTIVQNLSDQRELWGKTVTDERYMVIAKRNTR